jgi:hypothetical protein
MTFTPSARGECDCCGYPDIPLTRCAVSHQFRPENGEEVLLCSVCNSSMTGTWYICRKVQDPTKVDLARLIAWGINHLKAQTTETREDPMPRLIKVEPGGIQAIPKASPAEEDWCDNQFLCKHDRRYFVSGVYLVGGDLVVHTAGRKFDEVPIGQLAEIYHIEP